MRNVLLVALAVALAALCWAAPAALVVMGGGAFLAVLLSFPVAVASRVLPRPLAVMVVFLLVTGLVVVLFVLVVPPVIVQLAEAVRAVPAYGLQVDRLLRTRVLAPLDARGLLPAGVDDAVTQLYQTALRDVAATAQTLLGGLLGSLSGVANAGFLVTTMVVIALYFLVDARRIEAGYLRTVPRRYRRDARDLWRTMGQTLSRVAGASFAINTTEALIVWVGLLLIGVPAATLLAAVTWLTAFVPLLGPWLGAVPAALVALTVSPPAAALTTTLFVVSNVLIGNVFTPRILGSALSLPPAVTLAATIAAGQLFGLAGVILTMPVLAAVTVLATFLRARLRVRPAAAVAGS